VARAVKPEPPKPAPAPRPVVREPETADSLVKKAGGFVASGTYEGALAAFEDALRLEPGHILALQGKATCLLRLNRRSDAYDVYRRIIANYPKNLEAHRALVRLYAEDRRWRECLEGAENLLRVRANDAAGLELKGDALTNLGRRAEALAAYEAAAAVDPANENLRQKIEEVRVELPRPRAWGAARQRVRDPEPREHPARGRRPGGGARGVRSAYPTLSERRGGVGGPSRGPREDGAGRRRTTGVHGGAQGQPRE